jgi:hypothetical protein
MYQFVVISVILNAGWDKEEREDGASCLLVDNRIKVDLAAWNSVPDINDFYNGNFRYVRDYA